MVGTLPEHVLVVGLDYAPDSFGIAPYTTGLAESIAARGSKVDVICGMPYYPEWHVRSGYKRKLRSKETRNSVNVHRRRQFVPSKQSAIRRVLYESTFLGNASFGLPRIKPDVVVGVMPSLASGVLAARISRRLGIPLVLIVQDMLGKAAIQSGVRGGSRIARLTSKVETWVAGRADAVCIIASGFRGQLIESGIPAARIHRIHNWVHIDKPSGNRDETRKRLGLPLDAKIVLHSGNMGLKQGLDNIIETANLAATTNPELLFLLMGSGSQRAALEQRAQHLSNVLFLDPQDSETYPNILAASDVLVLNQRASVVDMSLPSKLTSYFASSRPVVAAVAETSEAAVTIRDGSLATVVPPENPTALLDGINLLVRDTEFAAQLGSRAREYAEINLSADAVLGRIHEIIGNVVIDNETRRSASTQIVVTS